MPSTVSHSAELIQSLVPPLREKKTVYINKKVIFLSVPKDANLRAVHKLDGVDPLITDPPPTSPTTL